MVPVISVDVYPYHFMAFSDLAYHLEDSLIGAFLLHCSA